MPESTRTNRFEYVGFWGRVGASLLDAFILIGPGLATFPLIQRLFRMRAPGPWIAASIAVRFVVLFFVTWFGGTPGKLILRMRIVDRDGEYLTPSRAVLRDAIPWADLLVLSIMIIQVMSTIPAGYVPDSWIELSRTLVRYGGAWPSFTTILSWMSLPDVLFVACSPRKQALHDLLAGSFVITLPAPETSHPAVTSVIET
jgi:uncharacterized RDD family membrane protein YckC